MHTRTSFPQLTFPETIYTQIADSIGRVAPETGGILGGNPATGQVTDFYFDFDATCSPSTYSVRTERVNPIIDAWNRSGVHLLGAIHSHPRGIQEPSEPDLDFAFRILRNAGNADLIHFWLPIVQSAADGPFSIRVFVVSRDIRGTVLELPFEVSEPKSFPVPSTIYEKTFERVSSSYDLERLWNGQIIAIGCGGAASFLEDIARSGLRHFILIDPDEVQFTNIATGQFYRSEIGLPKVEVLKARILNINPLACVRCCKQHLDEISDAEFRSLVFETDAWSEDIKARLLCGLTDNFWCQARVARLGLQFGLPTLEAQVYRKGCGAEIAFVHPDVHLQCIRCILSARYNSYLVGHFQNDAVSKGAQYFATPRLNATKLAIAMAMLHHGSQQPFWTSMIKRMGQRNFVQIRCDPDITSTLGLPNFDQAFAGAKGDQLFFDETIWRPQHPENIENGYSVTCPDCGGTGRLTDAIGKFGDTRLFPD